MNARLVSRRTYPANMVMHLQALASARSNDTALIVVRPEGPESEAAVDKKIDYATLDRKVRALAAILQERFAADERALLLLDNDEHYVIGFFACLYAGLIAVPAFPPESVQERHLARLFAIAADARACCILTTSEILPLISGAAAEQFRQAELIAVDTVEPDRASAWRP